MTTIPPIPKKPRPWYVRWLKRTVVILVVGAVAYFSIHTWRMATNTRRLQAAMQAAAAEMPDWQWDEKFEAGSFVRDEDNVAKDITTWMLSRGLTERTPRKVSPGWLVAYEAWERTNYSFTSSNYYDSIEFQINGMPNTKLPAKAMSGLGAIFGRQDARADLGMLRSWVDRPAGRYQYERQRKLLMLILLPMVQKIRELANILAWDASLSVELGNTDQALEDLHTIVMVARSFGDDPILISQLVRMAVGSVGATRLQRVLGQAERFDPAHLAALQAAYLAGAEQPILLSMARGERAFLFHDYRLLENDAELRKQFVNSWAFKSPLPDTGIKWLNSTLHHITPTQFYFPSAAGWPAEQAAILEYHNLLIELAKRPEGEWRAGLTTLPAWDKMPSFTRTLFSDGWFGKTSGPSPYEKMVLAVLRYRALMRSAATACAAERFRLATGRWPTGPAELAPKYLPAVPVDPFTQKALLWKTQPDGIVIYSVGRDGVDQGGEVLETRNGGPRDDGMRLYSPTARKQPAIPNEE